MITYLDAGWKDRLFCSLCGEEMWLAFVVEVAERSDWRCYRCEDQPKGGRPARCSGCGARVDGRDCVACGP